MALRLPPYVYGHGGPGFIAWQLASFREAGSAHWIGDPEHKVLPPLYPALPTPPACYLRSPEKSPSFTVCTEAYYAHNRNSLQHLSFRIAVEAADRAVNHFTDSHQNSAIACNISGTAPALVSAITSGAHIACVRTHALFSIQLPGRHEPSPGLSSLFLYLDSVGPAAVEHR